MIWRIGVVSFLLLSVTQAQMTQPATAPANQASPKGTLRLMNIALRDGDEATIRKVFAANTPLERKVVEQTARFASALTRLHQAAADVFGPEGAKAVTGDIGAASTDGLAAIERAEVVIDGDKATVKFTGALDPPVHLKNYNGEWKLPVSSLDQGADSQVMAERLAELSTLSLEARKTADEILAGKFKNADQAAQAWRSRMMQSVAPKASSTRP